MKRLLSILLSLAIVLPSAVIPVGAEISDTPLEASRINSEQLPEGNLIYMGTASVSVSETETVYSFPIYREGDLSGEASVDIHTLDMTAVYGKDYILLEDEIEKTGNGSSILENYATAEVDENAESEEEPEVAGAETEVAEAEQEVAEAEPEVAEAEPEVAEEEPEVVEAGSESDSEPSLRELKEQQTGFKTREINETSETETETENLQAPTQEDYQALADELVPQAMSQVEHSTETTITFAPDESEKIVRFKILDDNKSEGNEGFSLLLVNPQGAEVYNVTSLSVNIEDDEPRERSEISFTKPGYKSKDSIATVTIKRKGAEYSLCDFLLVSSYDTAVAGENYEEYNETITFMPYETEKEIEIPVSGEGEFKLLMRDLTGCSEGKYTETVIKIRESKNEQKLSAMSETLSTTIKINGTTYDMEYQMPDNTKNGAVSGTIFAQGYDSPPEVGTYYFSTDSAKGGIFGYGHYSGDKPWGCGVRHSDYKMDSSVASMDGGSHYGRLEYYHTTTWKNGKSYTKSSNIPLIYYQYMTPDWESTSSFGGGQRARFKVGSYSKDAEGKFSRTLDKAAIKLIDESDGKQKAATGDKSIEVYAIDQESNKTPKSYVRFYGLAAMYKKFTVSVLPVPDKSYKMGMNDTIDAEPLQVTLNSGVQRQGEKARDFYMNTNSKKSNVVLTINSSHINNITDKYGYVKGYKLELNPGTTADKKTLYYPEDFKTYLKSMEGKKVSNNLNFTSTNVENELKKIEGENAHLDTIPIDEYFVSWIESVQEKVVNDGFGYHQNIQLTPQVEYVNVNVEVLKNVGEGTGHFTDSALAEGQTVTYHAGDTLDLSAVADNEGYHVVGYQVSDNGGISYNTIANTTELMLRPNKSYKIRPVIAKDTNKIEIKFKSEAEKYLSVQGLITENDLNESAEEDLKKELRGRYVLNANPSAVKLSDKIKPVDGEIYTINFISKEDDTYIYRPVITQGNDTFKTNSYYALGAADELDNVITVDYEKIKKSELESFNVRGTVVSANVPIRSNGLEVKRLPLSGYTVAAGKGTQSENLSQTGGYMVDGAVSTSTEDGEYSLLDIKGCVGDVIPVYISNGVTKGSIHKVTLSTPDEKTNGVYTVNAGNADVSYPYGAPTVKDIMYSYDNPTNNANADNTLNQIRILDDNINITAIVDKAGREIGDVVFTVKTITGEATTYTAVQQGDDSNVYICTIPKMQDNLYAGDAVSVYIKDAETMTLQGGGDVDILYPNVDTGLTFYTASDLAVPMSFDFDNSSEIDIPLVGSAIGYGKSGLLNFGKTKWPDNTGYTIQVNADATFGGIAQKTAAEKKAFYDQFREAADQTAYEKRIANDLLSSNYGGGAPQPEDYPDGGYEEAFEDYSKTLNDAKAPFTGFNLQYMSVEAAFVMTFDFVRTPDDDYMFASGTVAVGGAFNFNKTMYTLISNVPVFLNIQAGLQANAVVSYVTEEGKNALSAGEFNSVGGNIANRLASDEVTLSVVISGKIQVGAGLCGVLSARGYVSLTFQFDIQCVGETGGALITAVGGVGFDIIIMSIDIDIVKFTAGFGTLDGKDETSFFNGLVGLSEKDLSSHKYSSGTADLSEFGKSGEITAMSIPQPVTISELVVGAPERTRPCIIPLNDDNSKSMMTFISNEVTSDEYNWARVYYSITNDEGGWNQPIMVCDDNTYDSMPVMKRVGNKVIIAWVDSNRILTEDDSEIDTLNSFDIVYTIYDISSGTMSDKIKVTDDNFFNLSPQINVMDNELVISYLKRDLSTSDGTNSSLIDFTRTYSTMAYRRYDISQAEPVALSDEMYVHICHETLTDPLVMDYHASELMLNNEKYLISTYSIDGDTDLTDGTDRELYLGIYNITNDYTYFPIQITDNDVAESSPKLTIVNDKLFLTWLSNGYMFNISNISEILEAIFTPVEEYDENGEPLSDTSVVMGKYVGHYLLGHDHREQKDWYKKSASELGMSDEAYNNSIYSDIANGDFRIITTNFQGNDDLRTSVGNYIITSNNDDVYVYYTEFGKDREKTGLEIYGVRYKRGEDEGDDSEWGFGKPVQITDFGKVIDELDLYMTADNEIHAVSNYYSQWTDSEDSNEPMKYSENTLVYIKFEPASSLDIENDNIVFPDKIVPGTSEELKLAIENNGLIDAQGYILRITDSNGTVICNETVNKKIEAGGSIDVDVMWQVPENVEGLSITAEVEELGVTESEIATVTKSVPFDTRLDMSGVTIECRDDGYYLNAVVTNNGSKASVSGNVQVSAENSNTNAVNTIADIDLPAIDSGDSVTIETPFKPHPNDFNHLGYIELSLKAMAGEDTAESHTTFNTSEPMLVVINDGADSISLDGKDDSAVLEPKAIPWNSYAGDVEFYSSDNSIALVDAQGNVTPVGNGTATLHAYYPKYGIEGEIEVIVTGMSTGTHSSGGGGGGAIKPTVAPTAEATEAPSTEVTQTPTDDGMPFTDVNGNDWFYDYVKYVYTNGLMNGISDTEFAPNSDVTRAMFVTVLYRMENEPDISDEMIGYPFEDVDAQSWYGDAVYWARHNGIVEGHSDTIFAPEQKITREQMAAIVYRYAQFKGYDVSVGEDTNILSYADAMSISEYAIPAMQWACGSGIINGKDNGILDPQGNTTRAEAATVFERMTENLK